MARHTWRIFVGWEGASGDDGDGRTSTLSNMLDCFVVGVVILRCVGSHHPSSRVELMRDGAEKIK